MGDSPVVRFAAELFQAPVSTVERNIRPISEKMSEKLRELITEALDSPAVMFTAVKFQAAVSTVRIETPGESRGWCHSSHPPPFSRIW